MGIYRPRGNPAQENQRLSQIGVHSRSQYEERKSVNRSDGTIALGYFDAAIAAKKVKDDHDKVVVIVSRHPAVLEWLEKSGPVPGGAGHYLSNKRGEGRPVEVITGNATPDDVRDRIVIGNLPLALAALARVVVAIEFDGAPPRGAEYTAADMVAAGADLRPYKVVGLSWENDAQLLS